MANRVLAGYVSPNDSGKYDLIVDHDGPASYVNSGTFATSGEQINASDFGLGGFEDVGADMISSDGVNEVIVVPGATIGGLTNLNPALPNSPGPAFTTAVLHWFTTAARATEVSNAVNLSGKFIRLRMVGV
jgi:hypothetical protein